MPPPDSPPPSPSPSPPYTIPATSTVQNALQMYTLSHLYSSTGGPTWAHADNWLEGDPCGGGDGGAAWYGIECSNGHVQSIDMKDNSLVGTLPSQLTSLPYLHSLDVSHNAISGTIPTEIGNFQSLTGNLNMYDTRISGTLPTELSKLQSLQGSLNLFWSRLSGTVPSELSQLSPNECALSSTVMPTNHYNCPLPSEIEKWSCTTQCVDQEEATTITASTSQHLYAMMSQARLDALPMVQPDASLLIAPSPPPVALPSPTLAPVIDDQNAPNANPSNDANTGANSGNNGNNSVVQGGASALEGGDAAATSGTIASVVLASILLLVCIGLFLRRKLRKSSTKKLPLLPAAQARPKIEVDDHDVATPRSIQDNGRGDSDGGSDHARLSDISGLLQRRVLYRIYSVGRHSDRRGSVVRAPPELLGRNPGRERVHLPGMVPNDGSLVSNPMSNPLLDDDNSTPRSLNVSTPRERPSETLLEDDLGDSVSQQGTPREKGRRARDQGSEAGSSHRGTPRGAYLGDYNPNGSDSNPSRSRTPSPERHATFATEVSKPSPHKHEAVMEGGFDLYGGLNLYGEHNSSSSEEDDDRTAGDDDDSTHVGRSVSQVDARASAKHDQSDEESDEESDENEEGFQTHRSGRSRSSYMSQGSNDGHSLVDVDKQRLSEFVAAGGEEDDQFDESVVYSNPASAPSAAPPNKGTRETVTGTISGPFGTRVRESRLVDNGGRRIRCVQPSALPQPGVLSTSVSRVTPWLTGKQPPQGATMPPRAADAVDRARPGRRSPLQHASHVMPPSASLGQPPSTQVQGAANSAKTDEKTVYTL